LGEAEAFTSGVPSSFTVSYYLEHFSLEQFEENLVKILQDKMDVKH
jgi:hypothetical protein